MPKIAEIIGLLSLSPQLMTAFVYIVTLIYALLYIFNVSLKGGAYIDIPLLVVGGYLSGASLIGAPLIVAVATRHLAAAELRTTLFVLWFILVCAKLTAFVIADVDLQLEYMLYLLPVAGLGHYLGLRFNDRLVSSGRDHFIRIIGLALIVISVLDLWRLYALD